MSLISARLHGASHDLRSDAYDALQGFAATDADMLAQALTWPGNLAATEAGATTALISDCLVYVGGSLGDIETDRGANGRLVSTLRRTGALREVAVEVSA